MAKFISYFCIVLLITGLFACNQSSELNTSFSPVHDGKRQSIFLLGGPSLNDFDTYDTFSMNVQGKMTTISNLPRWNGKPVSLNRKVVLELSDDQDIATSGMIILDLNSNEEKIVQFTEEPGRLFLSPNGNFVAYNTYSLGVNYLHLYSINEQEDKVVKTVEGDFTYLSGWSQDESRLFFLWKSEQTGNYDIYYFDKDFTIKQLTNDSDIEILFIDSPTEDLFLVGTIPIADLYSFENYPTHTTSKGYYLTNSVGVVSASFDTPIFTASWSPDGKHIAISIDGDLCLLEVNEFTHDCSFLPLKDYLTAGESPVAWSLDSRFIAFQATKTGDICRYLFIFDLQTEQLITPEIQSCIGTEIFSTRGE